jgi:dipeptidyl aminopeptidase/acylaminoacyl peptidase
MVGTVGSRSLKWPGGRGPIWFPLTELGATVLYTVEEAGGCRRMVDGGQVVHGLAASETGECVYDSGNPLSPSEVYRRRPEGQIERLTDLNPWLGSMRLPSPEEYWYNGLNGARVHAWVMKPVGFEAGRRYPLALQVHCSMFSWDFNIDFQCLASAGYVVAYFNQLGTTAGYGQAYTMASPGDQGGRDFEEIMIGVDDLIAKGYVDEKRMGVTGTSCGGFLSNWIVGHTDRFAAAIPQASISDYISFFGTSDIGPECTEGETLANPWTDLTAVWRQSPIQYVENIRTPVLLLHGAEDHRCALAQAEEMFAALRWLGKEVELVIFEGESHGMSRTGRPGNRIERLHRILGWFGKYLL